ncbi:MAG: hypothetical protein DWQ34_12365 [Planctomycetota bacterium]|nr:MAG: hypothetical protein DWQ34_12365 [Planctomycetota bacterium]REK29725.1 MAG: hypothetical protein DWQ41_03550 [Planctomycetota bacterium]REK30454.1 MAG: hypothetical protein DWQ45_21485 [Planctomycetota bacterium]
MPDPPSPTPTPNTACTACGKPFRCGFRAGESTCWCAALPQVIPVPAESSKESCLCPDCLRKQVEQMQQQ